MAALRQHPLFQARLPLDRCPGQRADWALRGAWRNEGNIADVRLG